MKWSGILLRILSQNQLHLIHAEPGVAGDLAAGQALAAAVENDFAQKLRRTADAFGLFQQAAQFLGAFCQLVVQAAQFGSRRRKRPQPYDAEDDEPRASPSPLVGNLLNVKV